MMPKLSIITINFNNAEGLEKTIQSVVGQCFEDYEYIVIDGKSSDASVDIIKSHQEKIAVWVSEKDHGIYHAMNKGIEFAKGEYCLFLNSGDYLVDASVLQKVFSKPLNEDILYGDLITIDQSGLTTKLASPDFIGIKRLLTDTLWHPVSFIKRKLFEEYGNYDENYKIVADYEFFVRVIIGKKASTKHLNVDVAFFSTNGISGAGSHRTLLIEERKSVQDIYFNPILLFFFRLYSKLRN